MRLSRKKSARPEDHASSREDAAAATRVPIDSRSYPVPRHLEPIDDAIPAPASVPESATHTTPGPGLIHRLGRLAARPIQAIKALVERAASLVGRQLDPERDLKEQVDGDLQAWMDRVQQIDAVVEMLQQAKPASHTTAIAPPPNATVDRLRHERAVVQQERILAFEGLQTAERQSEPQRDADRRQIGQLEQQHQVLGQLVSQRLEQQRSLEPQVRRGPRHEAHDAEGGRGLVRLIARLRKQCQRLDVRLACQRHGHASPVRIARTVAKRASVGEQLDAAVIRQQARMADPVLAQYRVRMQQRREAWESALRTEAQRVVPVSETTAPSGTAIPSTTMLPAPIPLPGTTQSQVVSVGGRWKDLDWAGLNASIPAEGIAHAKALAGILTALIDTRRPQAIRGRPPMPLLHGTITQPLTKGVDIDGRPVRYPRAPRMDQATADLLGRAFLQSCGMDPDRHSWCAIYHYSSGTCADGHGAVDDAENTVHVIVERMRDDGAYHVTEDAAVAAMLGRARWDVAAGWDASRGMGILSGRCGGIRASLDRMAQGMMAARYRLPDGSSEEIPLQDPAFQARWAAVQVPWQSCGGLWTWKKGETDRERIERLILHLLLRTK